MIAAAKKIKISAPTFCRILKNAHKKVGDEMIQQRLV
jgi:predicted DNA-binding protein (UPF0251 family)